MLGRGRWWSRWTDFYRPSTQRVAPPRVPGAHWDLERLVTDVPGPHAAGRAAHYQRYDWDDDRLAEWREVRADAIVVLEGVYTSTELLRPYIDYAIWVDCAYEVRLQRGLERDGEGMRAEWVEQWMPAENRYVEAERPDVGADLVLDGCGGAADGVVFEVVRARSSTRNPSPEPPQLSFEREGVELACLDFGGSGPPVLAPPRARWSRGGVG